MNNWELPEDFRRWGLQSKKPSVKELFTLVKDRGFHAHRDNSLAKEFGGVMVHLRENSLGVHLTAQVSTRRLQLDKLGVLEIELKEARAEMERITAIAESLGVVLGAKPRAGEFPSAFQYLHFGYV